MANPNVRIKRSSVAGKRPTIAQLELGELALNTNDGRLFTRKDNVGIGTTVTLLNPWTENIGGSVYYNDGSVGIGTTNPVEKLQVFGGVVAGDGTSGTYGSGYSILRPNDSQYRSFAIVENDTDLRIGGGAWNSVNIRTAPSNEVRVAITSSGNIGIGTTNPTSKLHIQGDALITGVTTSTDFNSASDIKLKDNIQPIENPIDKILNITGVSFDWKETGRSSMGVIAQEVEKVLPELVNGEETKTVNYNGLIGLLIEVVKEQQKEINNLKEKLQ